MARFVVDAQLPPVFAARLRKSGHDALHVSELRLGAATDRAIADVAFARGAIVISKDEDFAILCEEGVIRCPVLWIRIGNTTNEYLWRHVGLLLDEILEAFERGERVVEVHGRPVAL